MPKNKSKKKGAGRGDKEKPLLTVQGILRLDKTFAALLNNDLCSQANRTRKVNKLLVVLML